MPERDKVQILMVLTSQERFGEPGAQAGRKTGVWLDGFITPYFLLRDSGAELTLASPLGGAPPIDPDSRGTASAAASRLATDDCCRAALAETLMLRNVYALDFDAAYYCSGFGCYWDLATDETSHRVIAALQMAGRPVALVAQAVAALYRMPDAVAGRQMTGYSDQAARGDGIAGLLPFSLEEMLLRHGARYRHAPDPDRHVLRDGMLITGETTATSAAVARALLDAVPRSIHQRNPL